MTKGVVYIVFLNKNKPNIPQDYYFREAIYSVKTLKKIHPDLPVTLFTDSDPGIKEFDDVRLISAAGRARLKDQYLRESPYDYTLYIDSDTGIINPIVDHFRLLDRFDLAAVHDACRAVPERNKIWPAYGNIPNSFGEYCSGLIFYRKSPAMDKFFDLWRKNYEHWINFSGYKNDQPSFRVSLWECDDIKIHTLPIEFCVRTQEKLDKLRKKYLVHALVHHWHEMYNKGLNRKPHRIHL